MLLKNLENVKNFSKKIPCENIDEEKKNSAQAFSLSKINIKNLLEEFTPEIKHADATNITILTGNPLIEDSLSKKPLISINDFCRIPDFIYDVFLHSPKHIIAEFLPLTEDNLKNAIINKSDIIRLICKTCILPNNEGNKEETNIEKDNNKKENKNFTLNMLFENKKRELVKVTKKSFESYIKDKKNIDKILLIVSTPFSEDTFEMLKDIGFKNIIVQHTINSNISIIADFNKLLYEGIIYEGKKIKEAFEIAKKAKCSCKNNSFQNCCCFHKHSENCEFINNLETLEDYSKKHFGHLMYKCGCQNFKEYYFNEHIQNKIFICENIKESKFKKDNKRNKNNICCCKNGKIIKHNLDYCFFSFFSNPEFILFDNYNKSGFAYIKNDIYVPVYNSMKLLVGRNGIINEICYNLFSSNNIINVFGNESSEYNNYFCLNLKEYLIERLDPNIFYSYNIYNSPEFNIKKNISQNNGFKLNKLNDFSPMKEHIKNRKGSVKIRKTKKCTKRNSNIYPEKFNESKTTFSIIYINLNDNHGVGLDQISDNLNKIIIINCQIQHFEKIIRSFIYKNLSKLNIILVTDKKFPQNLSEESVNLTASEIFSSNLKNDERGEPDEKFNVFLDTLKNKVYHLQLQNLNKEDFHLKYESEKINNNKEKFEKMIEDNLNRYNNFTPYEEKEKEKEKKESHEEQECWYELIFLFENAISGFSFLDLKILYPNNFDIIKDLIENKTPKIINKDIEKQEYEPQYFFKKYYESKKDKIPEKIKLIVLEKLFKFYCKSFRAIIQNLYDKKEIFHSLFSFSAKQELGIWEPFEKTITDELKNYDSELTKQKDFCVRLSRNFRTTFNKENILICYKNKEIWKNIKDYLDDISITLPTCLLMYTNDIQKPLKSLLDIDDFWIKIFQKSQLRLKLYSTMIKEYNFHNNDNIIELDKLYKNFSEINYIQGNLEVLFGKCMIFYKDGKEYFKNQDFLDSEKIGNILDQINNIIANEINPILINLRKDKNIDFGDKERFIDLFESKVNYLLIKYKFQIPQDSVLDDDDFLKINKILFNFHKYKLYFYEIKVYIMLGKMYMKEYIDNNRSKAEHLKQFIDYLNVASFQSKNINQIKEHKDKFVFLTWYIQSRIKKLSSKYELKLREIRQEKDKKIRENRRKNVEDISKEICKKYGTLIEINDNINEEIYLFID